MDYSNYSDNQLIDLCGLEDKGKDLALREIIKRYGWRIFAYCRQKTESRDDAIELNQEIWVNFYESIKDKKINIKLPQYLFAIGNNIYADFYKTKLKTLRIDDVTFDLRYFFDPINLSDIIEKKDLIEIIKLATNNLSEVNKDTFILKWFSGLSISEIAETSGETIECIKQRCYRSMKELLLILKPIIDEVKHN